MPNRRYPSHEKGTYPVLPRRADIFEGPFASKKSSFFPDLFLNAAQKVIAERPWHLGL